MAIDRFTREQFEAVLPVSKKASIAPMIPAPIVTKLWTPLGLQDGEYTYKLPVTNTPFAIIIRSSVDSTGVAGKAGEDSIRCWIVLSADGRPWGSKLAKYVTRVPGWQERLLATLRGLWKMCLAIERCPNCKEWMKVFKVKKKGPNRGRVFIKCTRCEHGPMKWPKVA